MECERNRPRTETGRCAILYSLTPQVFYGGLRRISKDAQPFARVYAPEVDRLSSIPPTIRPLSDFRLRCSKFSRAHYNTHRHTPVSNSKRVVSPMISRIHHTRVCVTTNCHPCCSSGSREANAEGVRTAVHNPRCGSRTDS